MPFRIEPIFHYRMWGGRKLQSYSRTKLPGDGPIGEAWILSDRDDYASLVAEGPYRGKTLRSLIEFDPTAMLGNQARKFDRYPLLLKFLDAAEMLSVQVHPSDEMKDLLPNGERGKTEAWVVLDSEPASAIFAGLKTGITEAELTSRSNDGSVEEVLASFHPVKGDGLFIEAGTVHALGGGVVVFEVQQNSDVTFRLFDWNRVDANTGNPRDLHVDQAIKSTNLSAGAVGPTVPDVVSTSPIHTETLFDCEFFRTTRFVADQPLEILTLDQMRVLVFIEGSADFVGSSESFSARPGDVWVLPAGLEMIEVKPLGSIELLEVVVP